MSKMIDGTCSAHVVTADGIAVEGVEVLSQGTKSSTGVVLLQEDKAKYITSNATDIHDLIAQLSDLIQLVSDTFSAIGTGMTGPTTAPPASLPASITQLATMKAALTAMKDNLK